jgi:N-acetylglutamate synthase-like GNAT family acetyltransferase
MRSIRKAILEDVGALSDCDREFGFGSRKEFVERAIRRGGGYILEQEGTVIGVAALEYTFFEHGFISLLYVSVYVSAAAMSALPSAEPEPARCCCNT